MNTPTTTRTIQDIARNIAAALTAQRGALYQLAHDDDPATHTAQIDGPNDLGLILSNWPASKLEIKGRYPGQYAYNSLRNGEQLPSINVSIDRPAPAIARDISRRLMGPYRARLDMALQAQRQAEEHRNQIARTLAQLAEVMPGATTWTRGGAGVDHDATGIDAPYRIEAHARPDGTADLKLDKIPLDLARQLIQVLVTPQLTAEPEICESCGAEFDDDGKGYCVNCGYPPIGSSPDDDGTGHGDDCPVCPPDEQGRPACPASDDDPDCDCTGDQHDPACSTSTNATDGSYQESADQAATARRTAASTDPHQETRTP